MFHFCLLNYKPFFLLNYIFFQTFFFQSIVFLLQTLPILPHGWLFSSKHFLAFNQDCICLAFVSPLGVLNVSNVAWSAHFWALRLFQSWQTCLLRPFPCWFAKKWGKQSFTENIFGSWVIITLSQWSIKYKLIMGEIKCVRSSDIGLNDSINIVNCVEDEGFCWLIPYIECH